MNRLRLAYPLWRAMRRGELVLYFQPKAEPVSGRVRSVEALARWEHPRRGLLLPAEFLPAIDCGLWLRRFNRFVIREAVRRARVWELQGRALRTSINVSPAYVVCGEFVGYLREQVEQSGIDRALLCIEVPESPLLGLHDEALARVVGDVRALGIGVSIDDFGTGQSSLARLVELPLDELKIDRRFIARLPFDLKAHRVVRTAIELAHSIGLTVVAEGVETHEQWIQLTALGCDLVQGFRLQPPVPAQNLCCWLDEGDLEMAGAGSAVTGGHRRRFGQRALDAHPPAV